MSIIILQRKLKGQSNIQTDVFDLRDRQIVYDSKA